MSLNETPCDRCSVPSNFVILNRCKHFAFQKLSGRDFHVQGGQIRVPCIKENATLIPSSFSTSYHFHNFGLFPLSFFTTFFGIVSNFLTFVPLLSSQAAVSISGFYFLFNVQRLSFIFRIVFNGKKYERKIFSIPSSYQLFCGSV